MCQTVPDRLLAVSQADQNWITLQQMLATREYHERSVRRMDGALRISSNSFSGKWRTANRSHTEPVVAVKNHSVYGENFKQSILN